MGHGSIFFEKWTRGTCTSYLKSTVYEAKELQRVNRTYDSVFNLRFLQNIGVVLYNMGYQMIELFIPLQLIQVLTLD